MYCILDMASISHLKHRISRMSRNAHMLYINFAHTPYFHIRILNVILILGIGKRYPRTLVYFISGGHVIWKITKMK